jgi:hypothetical protein
MTLHVPVFPQGSRVRTRRGRFPMSAERMARTGIVVEVDDYRPDRYGVVLDGEEEVLDFTTDELERLDE